MPNKQYIGEKQIKSVVTDKKTGKVTIYFKDDPQVEMYKELFDNIVSEEKNRGNVTDAVNHYFAKKFLIELAVHDLDYYMVENVGTSMGVLAHNLREELTSKTFNCTGSNGIPLKKLINNEPDEEAE